MSCRFALCSLTLLLGACFGPQPSVVRVELERVEKDRGSYVLTVEIHNRTGGEGEINVEGKLIEPSSGKTYRAEKKVHMAGQETTVVTLKIDAPPANYRPEVAAEYPPD